MACVTPGLQQQQQQQPVYKSVPKPMHHYNATCLQNADLVKPLEKLDDDDNNMERDGLKKMANKAAAKIIPGLSKGKKYGWKAKNRNPKVTAAGTAKLGVDLLIAALKGPLSFGSQLLLSGQKIGTLLGTNYKMPLGDPKSYEKAKMKLYLRTGKW